MARPPMASANVTICSHSGGPTGRTGSGAGAMGWRRARVACAFGWPFVAVAGADAVAWPAGCAERGEPVEEPPAVRDEFGPLLAAARLFLLAADRLRERAFELAIGSSPVLLAGLVRG